MKEGSPQRFERKPLGRMPKPVRLSYDEMHMAWVRKQATGEPIQTWVRRLVRENWTNVPEGTEKHPLDIVRDEIDRLLPKEPRAKAADAAE